MTDVDLIQEAASHAQHWRDSMLSFVKSSIGERISYHRDIAGLSILLLGGVVTLFNVTDGEDLIKTKWLLYVAGAVLITASALCIIVRIKLLDYLQRTVGLVETRLGNVNSAVRNLRSLAVRTPAANEGETAVAVNNLVNAETPADLPRLHRLLDQAHLWVGVLLIAALILIALSLLIKIGV